MSEQKPSVGRIVQWKPVLGYEDLYEVSDDGQVRRSQGGPGTRAGYVLKLRLWSFYYQVHLCRDGVSKDRYVHHLVAEAFVGPRPKGQEVNHKDLDKRNNHASNLEYLTRSGNALHSYANGQKRPWGNQHWKHRKSLQSGG